MLVRSYGVSCEKKLNCQKLVNTFNNKCVTIHILRYYSFKKKHRNPLLVSHICFNKKVSSSKRKRKQKNTCDLPLLAANMSIIRPGVQTIISAPLFSSAI